MPIATKKSKSATIAICNCSESDKPPAIINERTAIIIIPTPNINHLVWNGSLFFFFSRIMPSTLFDKGTSKNFSFKR